MPRRSRLLVLLISVAACRADRVAPPPADFLLAAGDSTFWVRSSAEGIRIRGSPIRLAYVDGRYHEVYVADDDRSHYDAVLLGQRIYSRDIESGDSLLVFEDTTVAGFARWYGREHPGDRPLGPDEEPSEDPHIVAVGEVEILGQHGPFLSFEYHADASIVGGSEWHHARRGVVDLRTGRAAAVKNLFGTDAASRLLTEGLRHFSQTLDSVLASRDARAGDAAAAIADFDFDSTSFALVADGRVPAIEFAVPGEGVRAGGLLIFLPPVRGDSSVPWWAPVLPTLPLQPADSTTDRWKPGSVEVIARYDTAGTRAQIVLLDSARREWPVGRVPAPADRLHWLDTGGVDTQGGTTRKALSRAFDEAALYADDSRTASIVRPSRARSRGARLAAAANVRQHWARLARS